MKLFTISLFLPLLAFLASQHVAQGFVKGYVASRSRPHDVDLHMAAAKKAAKKKAAKAATVETVRKPEFVSSVAEKLECSKADAELAVAAVLDTVQEVSRLYQPMPVDDCKFQLAFEVLT